MYTERQSNQNNQNKSEKAKSEKAKTLILPDFKTCYETIITITMWYGEKIGLQIKGTE